MYENKSTTLEKFLETKNSYLEHISKGNNNVYLNKIRRI